MPQTDVIFYREEEKIPVLDWLDGIFNRDRVAFQKCWDRIRLLGECGSELRRPIADYLDDGIYELRISHQHVNYRILYAFVGQNVALLTNGLVKEGKVPSQEIRLAVKRKQAFEDNPSEHIHREF